MNTAAQPNKQWSPWRNGEVPGLCDNSEPLRDQSFDEIARATLYCISDAVVAVDLRGRVTYLNRVAEAMTGWSKKFAIGRPLEEVVAIVDSASGHRRISPSQKAIKAGQVVELRLGSKLIRNNGTEIAIEDSACPVRNSRGKVVGAVVVFHDAKLSRVEIQRMSHLAQHDALTGLPNRVSLAERLTQAIGMAERHHNLFALLFVDVDCFKQVNDTLGHAIGDQVLQNVAENIQACVRATDTVSRHGGDEFVILLPQIEDIDDPYLIAEKLRDRFNLPRTIAGHKLEVTVSIGISVYPNDGIEADALMQKADAAMYENKMDNRKRNCF